MGIFWPTFMVCALAVGGADAGVLQDAGVGVGEQRVDGGGADGHGEVVGVEMGEGVEGEVGGVVVPVPVPFVGVLPLVVVVWVACGLMLADCGRVMPRLRILSRLTSRTATSTTTSGRARSRSFSSFCAMSSSSGVARMTMAFWLGTR